MSTLIRNPEAEPIRTQLIVDHERLEDALEDMLEALAEGDARALALARSSQLAHACEAHFHAEERYLFPLLEEVDAAEIAGLFAEHQQLRRQLVDLRVAVEQSLVRMEVAQALVEALRIHTRREELLLSQWSSWLIAVSGRRRVLDWLAS